MSGADVAIRRLGAVEAFMLARLVPADGQQLTCSEAFRSYRGWCDAEGLARSASRSSRGPSRLWPERPAFPCASVAAI